ncbi:Mitochondrial amidoxime reducing component 2 [Pseudocercospora fuligena]|uniref:Mitochondrial amidoxime reducing component 2 n=1 Tax=Pseudocercospora fuligena TaxID=685502 RepID=A0A8H6RWL7_9PEZI|nr:Mitochondrial amidoxime reducing component 2 [Pseudocercospora fuligena]
MEVLVALFWHFVAYFHSWKGSAALVIAAVLIYKLRPRWQKKSKSNTKAILPLRRYDCEGSSRLESLRSLDGDDQSASVKGLLVYPLKSCKGIEVPIARVDKTGFRFDRLFSFAECKGGNWRIITQREYSKLALIETELWLPDSSHAEQYEKSSGEKKSCATEMRTAPSNVTKQETGHDGEPTPSGHSHAIDRVRDVRANGGFLLVRFAFEDDVTTLRVPLCPTPERAAAKKYRPENLSVWIDTPKAIDVTSEIKSSDVERLQRFLGVKHSLGLFRMDESNLRTITRSLPKDLPDEHFEVGLADAFPVHLINIASVRELNMSMDPQIEIKNLDVGRFRANIIVSAPAYEEDSWKRVCIGNTIYHVACRTARCPLANVDQETGVMARHEPLRTLKRTRVVDEGAKPHAVLGLSMIPLGRLGKASICVEDQVEVMKTGEHFYEKMFK